jgi:response regulator of citrate/malate metabolism
MAMTMREMFMAIVDGKVDAEVQAMAQAQLDKMDAANVRKNSKARAKANEANAPLMEKIALLLTDKGMLAADVAAAIEVSPQKAQALLRKMVEAGTLTVEDVNIPGKGVRKMYKG